MQQPTHVFMGNSNAFRHSRSTRRVDQIGDIVGAQSRQRCVRRLDSQLWTIDIDNHHPARIQPIHQVAGGHRHHRLRIGEHEFQPRVGHRRVDGYVCRTGFEHSHDRDNGLHRSCEQQRDSLPGPGPILNKLVCQPIRCFVQLLIRQVAACGAHGNRTGDLRYLLREQCRNRYRGHGPRQLRTISPLVQPSQLFGVQHVDRGQRSRRVRGHRIQHATQSINQHLDTSGVKHIGSELDRARDTRSLACFGPGFGQRERQIHTGRMRIEG
ncbi:Uncharacterised protein [Mycobacteroides abscessus]|nr:Uncharacterised protein [Mycobacteroides abscessus]